MDGFDAWENELFNEYNGEGGMTEEEFWFNAWEDLIADRKER